MYDVIIIGAGPAGATLARLLAYKRSVLLVEGRRMGSFGKEAPSREKCCGGLIAPDAQRWLRDHGLVVPKSILETEQPLSVRAIDISSGLTRAYQRRYLNVSRSALEQWFLSLVPGVKLLDGHRCTAIERNGPGGWRVRLQGPDGPQYRTARFIVGADGANSLVRRAFKAEVGPESRYMAVQDSFLPSKSGGEPCYAAFFDETITDFYGWLIPKNDRVLLGMALPDGCEDVAGRMERLRTSANRFGFQLSGESQRQGCRLIRPEPKDVWCGTGDILCIGEAAGWISPSSAEGLSYAFVSAKALAEALIAHNVPEAVLRAYRQATLPLRLNLAWKRAKSFAMYTPSMRRLAMRGGLASKWTEGLGATASLTESPSRP